MKKIILLAVLTAFLGLVAYARVNVDVGFGVGVPAPVYYSAPPPYYDPYVETTWMDTPVQVVYFDGAPHRMHYWRGHWYDEAWRGHHSHDWH